MDHWLGIGLAAIAKPDGFFEDEERAIGEDQARRRGEARELFKDVTRRETKIASVVRNRLRKKQEREDL
jgi:hypothetical protein